MRAYSCAGVVLVVVLCSSAPRAARAGEWRPIDFEPVWVAPTNEIELTGDYVFRDQASWCEFWAAVSISMSAIPPLECPFVDFRRAVVIATVGGFGTCTGQGISAVERARGRRAVRVTVLHSFPGPGCLCVQWYHGSVSAVAVARPVGNVVFAHESAQSSCSLVPLDPSEPVPLPIGDPIGPVDLIQLP